jgi:hypothetical protein
VPGFNNWDEETAELNTTDDIEDVPELKFLYLQDIRDMWKIYSPLSGLGIVYKYI